MSNYTDSLEFENDILKAKNAKLIEALTDIHECSRLPQKHRNRIINEIISVSKKALEVK
ncbi:MAG: hypothetical protein ACTSX1_11820 [Candidatus Heimdallarchaeaceae archaeon]